MDKRTFIKSLALAATGVVVTGAGRRGGQTVLAQTLPNRQGEFLLPQLPYAYQALEPYIDAATMEIHHSRHHAAYTNNFNAAIKENGLTGKSEAEIFSQVSKYPAALRNDGGGFYNHKLFWETLGPPKGQIPTGNLAGAIERDFGSFSQFRDQFSAAARSLFGSGWVWLIHSDGRLMITSTPNQDNPLMDLVREKGHPLLLLDVWEHAYYLKYQNRRAEYIDAFWNVVNWEMAGKRYAEAMKT